MTDPALLVQRRLRAAGFGSRRRRIARPVVVAIQCSTASRNTLVTG